MAEETSKSQWILRGVILVLAAAVGITLYEVETYQKRLPPPPQLPETREVALAQMFPKMVLELPIWLGHPPGDTSRIYGVEVKGRVVSFANDADAKDRKLELDITDRVEQHGELGFFGIAFHPDFATNGAFFTNYTSRVGGKLHSRISRFVRGADGKFDPGKEEILLTVDQPYETHNGGAIMFGPDGYLYIGFGDGGMAGDLHDNAQDPNKLLGKILRVKANPTGDFEIPPDNPYAQGGGRPEVYALGFRNPWRFSFDRQTGDLWVGDVGQDAYEEIDIVQKGKNYGWPTFEGSSCYDPPAYFKVFGWGDCDEPPENYVPPVLDYSHGGGDLSVTGGVVYRGPGLPQIQGHYVYADFISGKIWAWDPTEKQNRLLWDTDHLIPSFWQFEDGRAGFVDFTAGTIWTFGEAGTAEPAAAPAPTEPAQDTGVGDAATSADAGAPEADRAD